MDGATVLGRGRMAVVYAWGDGRALRLLGEDVPLERAEREAAAMRAASSAGAAVPAVHDVVTVDGRAGIVMDRVDGGDMLTLIGKRPDRVLTYAAQCARVHAGVVASAAPPGLPPVHDGVRARLADAEVPPQLRERALRVLESLPHGDRLCHGDFHPGNVLLSPAGPVVIDWNVASAGDPAADHANTRVLLRAADAPPGTPAPLRGFIAVGRGIFAARYDAVFRRLVTVDRDRVGAWTGVLAAARVSERIDHERKGLLALSERSLAGR